MRCSLWCLLVLVVTAAPVSAQEVKVESFTLDNGMEFLLLPRGEKTNSIYCGWMARVGSVNERPGITGISHFFEHMMFKGTNTIGTHDPETDREFREAQEAVRSKLRAAHLDLQYARWKAGEIDDPWDPKNDTEAMAKLRGELTRLMEEQGKITIKNEFDKIYTAMGGSRMNAFTSHDITFYFIQVPSTRFELWAWMESDRLVDSVFREFYEERDVVHEERRMRTESTPTGIYDEQFDAMFWQSSPYSWPVIGWTHDLNSYTREQAEDYYRTYYAPNNLVGVIVGDFDPAAVRPMIKKYYDRLERGPKAPPVVTLEMKQLAEKVMVAECDCPPQVTVRYHAVPFNHADGFVLEVLAELLNGQTGRLYKTMVEGKEVATSAFAGYDARKYAGAFNFSAECKGDVTPEEVAEVWDEIVETFKTELVGKRELEKVKNRLLADSYRRLQDDFYLMIQLAFYEALGGWEYINDGPGKLAAVTAEDILDVANKYLNKTQRSVAIYRRKGGEAAAAEPAADPELEALPQSLRQHARMVLSFVRGTEEVDKLMEMREQMQASADKATEEQRQLIELLVKRIDARIEEIGK